MGSIQVKSGEVIIANSFDINKNFVKQNAEGLFDLNDYKITPSRRDGITEEEENRLRKQAVKDIIVPIGDKLKLNMHRTIASASVFFHRFYMYNSFKNPGFEYVALSCLLLATKVEGMRKSIPDIEAIALDLRPDLFTQEDAENGNINLKIRLAERILLKTLKFDLTIVHPYFFVIQYYQIFLIEDKDSKHFLECAWTFTNDCYHTVSCIFWEPEVIAIAVLEMAQIKLKVTVPDWKWHETWWKKIIENFSQEIIDSIIHSLLDSYEDFKPSKRASAISETESRSEAAAISETESKSEAADTKETESKSK